MKTSDRDNSIKNQEVRDVVLEIHQEKNDVPWYRGRMGNGEWITLNRPMVYSIAVGDSIIKKKGETYFVLRKKTFYKRCEHHKEISLGNLFDSMSG